MGDASVLGEPQAPVLHRALAVLTGALGPQFRLVKRLPGASGAGRWPSPDGAHAMLRVFNDSSCDRVAQLVRLVEHVRAAGYPTPHPLYSP